MLAMLRDLGLETYVKKDTTPPAPASLANLTKDKMKAIKKWQKQDVKARMKIKLVISDSMLVNSNGQVWFGLVWFRPENSEP